MNIERMAQMWAVKNIPPPHADLVVLIAHGATKNRETYGMRAVNRKAEEVIASQQTPPEAIAFCAFGDSGNLTIERSSREAIFPQADFCGYVMSTIEECLAIRKQYPDGYFDHKVIVVITDEAHSRRCRIVWKTFFKKSLICIITVPITETVDPESPMKPYHRIGSILCYQAYPTPVFWAASLLGETGLKLLQGFHQPT